jgi:hypothetical protein
VNGYTQSKDTGVKQVYAAIAVGIALMGGVTYVVLTQPVPPPMIGLAWDMSDDPNAWYEFASSTNLSKPNSWYFKALVPPTNRCYFPMTNRNEFFAIRAALPYVTGPTNNQVTNWMYSAYSQSTR